MPPGGRNGGAPGIPGMGGPLPCGEPAGGKGGKGMPRPPGAVREELLVLVKEMGEKQEKGGWGGGGGGYVV